MKLSVDHTVPPRLSKIRNRMIPLIVGTLIAIFIILFVYAVHEKRIPPWSPDGRKGSFDSAKTGVSQS